MKKTKLLGLMLLVENEQRDKNLSIHKKLQKSLYDFLYVNGKKSDIQSCANTFCSRCSIPLTGAYLLIFLVPGL